LKACLVSLEPLDYEVSEDPLDLKDHPELRAKKDYQFP
jgi:hypothetical protein